MGSIIIKNQTIKMTEFENMYYGLKQEGVGCYTRQYSNIIVILYWDDKYSHYAIKCFNDKGVNWYSGWAGKVKNRLGKRYCYGDFKKFLSQKLPNKMPLRSGFVAVKR